MAGDLRPAVIYRPDTHPCAVCGEAREVLWHRRRGTLDPRAPGVCEECVTRAAVAFLADLAAPLPSESARCPECDHPLWFNHHDGWHCPQPGAHRRADSDPIVCPRCKVKNWDARAAESHARWCASLARPAPAEEPRCATCGGGGRIYAGDPNGPWPCPDCGGSARAAPGGTRP